MNILYLGSNVKKKSEKGVSKIEVRFAGGKYKISSLELKMQKYQIFKEKINNMEQVSTDGVLGY